MEIRPESAYDISTDILIYHRLTVIASDLILWYTTSKLLSSPNNGHIKNIFALLIFGNVGLLIIDHIHFQYNGLLFGILLWSIQEIMNSNFKIAAMLYAVVLNFKHLFLCMAPVYGLYLLRNYCRNVQRFCQLGSITFAIFAISFGPFWNQLPAVLRQMFPFQRGLCHAYWAPNFWPLYIMVDKFLKLIGIKYFVLQICRLPILKLIRLRSKFSYFSK